MTLLVASKLISRGRGLASAVLRRAATLALDWDTRQKSRFEAADAGGRRIGVFLPRGTIVRGSDVLVGEDGSLIVVVALAQPVLLVTARAASRDPERDLLRAAYHLGNRHVPVEVQRARLVLERDHVLAELLARMGLGVVDAELPFEPEGGAYATAAGHAHAHGHDDDLDHRHDHDHDHSHDDDHGKGRSHGPPRR